MEKELLSVIVLAYKQGELIFETLDSIFCQDYPEIELIIAEDGDPDFDKFSVEEYIKDHAGSNIKSSTVYVQPVNVGTVKNINTAIKIATGKYIKIIAGDDTYPQKDVFSKQVEYLAGNPDCPLVSGNVAECDADMKVVSYCGFAPYGKEHLLTGDRIKLLRLIVRKMPNLLSTQSICFRKDYLEDMGLFDERFRLIEDLPFVVSLINSDAKIGYIDYPCVNHRGAVGISTSNNAFDERRIAYYTDLKTYYEVSLMPIKDKVGRLYVSMRYQLMCFRIKYSNKSLSKLQRLGLLIRYSLPVLYYMATNIKRSKFYLKG